MREQKEITYQTVASYTRRLRYQYCITRSVLPFHRCVTRQRSAGERDEPKMRARYTLGLPLLIAHCSAVQHERRRRCAVTMTSWPLLGIFQLSSHIARQSPSRRRRIRDTLRTRRIRIVVMPQGVFQLAVVVYYCYTVLCVCICMCVSAVWSSCKWPK